MKKLMKVAMIYFFALFSKAAFSADCSSFWTTTGNQYTGFNSGIPPGTVCELVGYIKSYSTDNASISDLGAIYNGFYTYSGKMSIVLSPDPAGSNFSWANRELVFNVGFQLLQRTVNGHGISTSYTPISRAVIRAYEQIDKVQVTLGTITQFCGSGETVPCMPADLFVTNIKIMR